MSEDKESQMEPNMSEDKESQMEFDITNEFSRVKIKKIFTDQGHRLEISSNEHSIRLDAVALEAIAWQNMEKISKLISESPRGPYEEFPEELSAAYSDLSKDDEA